MTNEQQYFFSGVRAAVDVSEVILALASGQPLKVERLSYSLLPAVVLLATVGLRTYQQQIVDDYPFLLDRLEGCFKDNTEESWHCWHPHLHLAASISQRGPRGEYTLDEHPETGYMFKVYEQLVGQELTQLFPRGVLQ